MQSFSSTKDSLSLDFESTKGQDILIMSLPHTLTGMNMTQSFHTYIQKIDEADETWNSHANASAQ